MVAAQALREGDRPAAAAAPISRTRAEGGTSDVIQALHLALRRDARAGDALPEGGAGLGRAHRQLRACRRTTGG